MIHKDRLLAGLRNPPADARTDHQASLEERALTPTALMAAQITGDESTWAEHEAVALTLGIAAHQKWFDPRRGRLCVGGLARTTDRVPDTGPGGAALTRIRHITRAVHDRKPLTVRRYLVEFGKLQVGDSRLNLVLLAVQAAILFGPDHEEAKKILHQWATTYQRGQKHSSANRQKESTL